MKSSLFKKICDIANKKKQSLLILLSIIFWIAAVAYSLYLGNNLRYPDEVKYFNLYGKNLATLHIFSLDGIHPTAYNPPLYPLLIGLLIKFGADVVFVRLANYLALFISTIIVFLFLKEKSFKYAPIISVLMILAYPVLFYTAGTLYPQTIGSLFLLLAIYFFWKPFFSYKHAIFSGIFLGLAILTIPTFLFVVPFLLIYALFTRKKILGKMVILTLFTGLFIFPWTFRNYLTFNRFVLFSTNFGSTFLIGNFSTTTPDSGPATWTDIDEYKKQVDNLGLDEFESNNFYTKVAINQIKQNPLHFAALYLLKVINFFNFRNKLVTSAESSPIRDIVMLVSYGFMLCVAIIRLGYSRKTPLSQHEMFLILFYISSAFVSAIIFTRIRYRLPFDFYLILFDALALERLCEQISPKNPSTKRNYTFQSNKE